METDKPSGDWVRPVVESLWKDEFETKCALGGKLNEGKPAQGITPRWIATVLQPKLEKIETDKEKVRKVLEDTMRRTHFRCCCNSKRNCLCNDGKTQAECIENMVAALQTALRIHHITD